MNIEQNIEKISDLIDDIDVDTLTGEEIEEFLVLSGKISSDIEKADNIPKIIDQFKENNKRSVVNHLKAELVSQIERTIKMKEKKSDSLKQTLPPLSAPSPYDNN